MLSLFTKLLRRWRRAYYLKRQANHSSNLDPSLSYNSKPKTSVVIQLFNKAANIPLILAALKSTSVEELIVLDDGSSDGALDILPGLLRNKNEFIIRSNDLFEVRTYARALDFTRGEIVALLQDDDLPDPDGNWLTDALEVFEAWPKLAILGGREGLSLFPSKSGAPELEYSLEKLGTGSNEGRFHFVEVVNRAPMLLRRSMIRELGSIDQAFAPFQCDDVDLCLRAWQAGLQVGLYPTSFVRDVSMGGMRLFNAERIPEQAKKNWKIIYDRYGDEIREGVFAEKVRLANKQILR